jgi:CubicO group peptidase (beta-lactamase class C family)
MRAFLFSLLTVSAMSNLQTQTPPQTQGQPLPDSLEAFLLSQMHKRRIPGLQLAAVQNGTLVKLGAYGLANIEHSVPVTTQTVFTINSIAKAFAGVAIMQLVEEGKLDIAAPLSRYFDGLPAAWQAVTVQQLLTHTSGLPSYRDEIGKMAANEGDDASWAKVQSLPIEFAPGEQFSYNPTNYLLLGQIIDTLSGQPFSQFITERQLQVVGMPLTVFVDSHDVVLHSARGYTFFRNVGGEERRTDKLGTVFEEVPPFLRTSSGMSSTAEEMARWIIALQQGQLLKSKTSLATLWTPATLNDGSLGGFSQLLNGYALGWPTATRAKHRAVAAIGGARSALFIYPDDDLAVVILTNLQGAFPEEFIDEVATYYIPEMRASAGLS